MAKLPPIELEKLTTADGKNFIYRVKPLPASILNRMTEAEQMARQKEERRAIDAAYNKHHARN